jgi:hypothetical protein
VARARKTSSGGTFKDDAPTIPDMPSGVPRAPLDVESAPLDVGSAPTVPLRAHPVGTHNAAPPAAAHPVGRMPVARPSRARGVDLDALWSIYEAGLRAWGKMTATGAPRDLETEVVNGVGRLGQFLRAPDRAPPDVEQRAAGVAVKVKLAVARYDSWLASRPK